VIHAWSKETALNTNWLGGIGAKVGPYAEYTSECPELDGSDGYGGFPTEQRPLWSVGFRIGPAEQL